MTFSNLLLYGSLGVIGLTITVALTVTVVRYHEDALGLEFSGAQERFIAESKGFLTGRQYKAHMEKTEEDERKEREWQEKARAERQRREAVDEAARTVKDPVVLVNLERAVELGGFNCPKAISAYRQSADEYGQPFLVTCTIGSSAVMYSLTLRSHDLPIVKFVSRF